MSKIALQADPSGTGVFTIASPNSNTNRTLTLPDAGGEVLTDSQNDAAKLFRRDNILGTVSESGGVPTGAIIERGSNANGEFVKFADGTMICTRDIGVNHTSTGIQTFTWPAAFSSAVIGVAIRFASTSTLSRIDRYSNCSGQANASTAIFAIGTGGTSAETLTHTISGIGRWY